MTKKVVIASENPVKINAVIEGFENIFPEENFEYEWVSAASLVSDQPMSNNETLSWAQNRAMNAAESFISAEYWVWIEWWIEKQGDEMVSFAWVVILRRNSRMIWKSKTGTLFLPRKIRDLIDSGKELGHAADEVFWLSHSKHKTGTTWFLTGDVITRSKYYSDAVVLALVPFRNLEIY